MNHFNIYSDNELYELACDKNDGETICSNGQIFIIICKNYTEYPKFRYNTLNSITIAPLNNPKQTKNLNYYQNNSNVNKTKIKQSFEYYENGNLKKETYEFTDLEQKQTTSSYPNHEYYNFLQRRIG
ncbi:Hypothetical protein KVN_LOCUS522 [uncultured virus]|nr:Hypothetical protein KVN_LOCUS522 [uncultured virus]